MDQDGDADNRPHRTENWWARRNRHAVLLGVIGALLVVNLVSGVLVPYATHALVIEPRWNEANGAGCVSDPPNSYCVQPMPKEQVWEHLWDDYWLSLGMSLAGGYLLFPPVWLALSTKLIWFPFQPFVWILAVASGPVVWRYARPMQIAARIGYAAATMLIASGFLWYYWPPLD